MVRAALDLAEITSEDPHAGLAGSGGAGKIIRAILRLYDDAIAQLETEWKIEQARTGRRSRA